MHVAVNIVGARRRCSVVLMLGHRRQWGHRFGVCRPGLRLFPVSIDCFPDSFSKSITVSLGAIFI